MRRPAALIGITNVMLTRERRESYMIRNLGIRVSVLLFFVMALFSGTAHAYQASTFRLRIEDPTTGQGRVITDQWTNGFGNGNGDQNSTPGIMYFSGYVENPQF